MSSDVPRQDRLGSGDPAMGFEGAPEVVEGEVLGLSESERLTGRLYRIRPEDMSASAVENAVRENPSLLIAAYGDEYKGARTDMTGLLNKQAFHERFMSLSAGELAASGIFALMIIDVDNFKRVNDKSGYAEGDRLLKALAQKLRTVDLLFRIGGDEYAALLVDSESEEGELLSAEERLGVVEERMVRDSRQVFAEEFPDHPRLDVSIGSVALSEELGEGVTPQILFGLANGALKLVKEANKRTERRRTRLRVRVGRFIGRAGYRLSEDYDERLMP